MKIAYCLDHDESVQPDTGEYAAFWGLLRRLPVEVIPLDGDCAALSECDALLVGNPSRPFSPDRIDAIHRWVHGGGRALLLSSKGGGSAVDARSGRSNSLDKLVDGVSFADSCAGRPAHPNGFQSRCEVDATPLLGETGRFEFVDGCPLELSAGVMWSLPFPRDALAMRRVRIDDGRISVSGRPAPVGGGAALAELRQGLGSVICCGTSKSLSDEAFKDTRSNVLFAIALLRRWLPGIELAEVERRKRGPQRHRLLNAYPMAPMMYRKTDRPPESPIEVQFAARDPSRRLLVGVLPHPYCNPRVRGCGFCTFPHEAYRSRDAKRVAKTVHREIEDRFRNFPNLRGAPCDVLYFGGATANLTPIHDIERIVQTVHDELDASGAEITIEGAPVYFMRGNGPDLLALLAEAGPRSRISVGVQSFDPEWQAAMGRQSYGTTAEIARLNEAAHRVDLSTSCDMLIDLPGQQLSEVISDLRLAVECGFDQICVYHLVLFEGLGTEWSKDPAMLAGLPSNEAAAARWGEVRAFLNAAGFVQTTLTNFERREVIAAGRNFVYEPTEMALEHDFIGFGPAAITRISPASLTRGVKFTNPTTSTEYLARMEETTNGLPWETYFEFGHRDMEILYVTRQIGRGYIDLRGFERHFGRPVADAFPRLWPEFLRQGWLVEDGRLTAAGNSYADSFAGALAWPRVMEIEARDRVRLHVPRPEAVYNNRSATWHMG